ncbi:hypothetical protein [Pectobacterium phage Wc4-1]|jgi:hypothetical protein|uniref:Uncharacterized protein n=3 Tax=Arnovirus TaxID=3425109 RepID=A0A5P8D6D4_9CAUD|nr:hypothetical protein Arno162_67 [Pectobacterium phage Arno162]AZV02252.1 hypothetical protein Arno18_66 [Pectobacterium phage Arno18]QFP93879.1 hypothetical protein [Pectobacterium phage Wc4]QFP94024.1 hypothetical protein [Pectobacterium phage Wc4-1]
MQPFNQRDDGGVEFFLNRRRVYNPEKRVESEHYKGSDLDLYLYFQNLGKYPVESHLR